MTRTGISSFIFFSLAPLFPCLALTDTSSGVKTDIIYYDLQVAISPEQNSLSGVNYITGRAISKGNKIQMKLSQALSADSIFWGTSKTEFHHKGDILEITVKASLQVGDEFYLSVFYHGTPVKAANPPWDGGMVWEKDSLNRHWAGVTCEGEGAKIWWPCKDEWSDEPDSMSMSFTVPSELALISNGRLIRKQDLGDGRTMHRWSVSYPINLYNVTFYLGNYRHFSDTLIVNGLVLPLDFYVLDYNLQKAQAHFQQTKQILNTFQTLFGPYPFPQDGYALVEAPYWGMEHQSAVAYGNNYQNDVLGMDFIIIHETAHEWWGNNVSASDHGEMWIHEAFATYSEALLFEKIYGAEKATAYLLHQKEKIQNAVPMLVNEGFNDWPDADMYYKGSWMLHSLRNYLGNDSLWFSSFRKFQQEYKYSIVTTEGVVSFFSREADQDLKPFFKRYLRFATPPELLYYISKYKGRWILHYRWDCNVNDFRMPFEVTSGKESLTLEAGTEWQKIELGKKKPKPDFNSSRFYYTIREALY